ncbi:MAG: hypothetical protein KAR19_13415 [Bacteroidales bacterium]|nr:hypothetical protein [Bacteroidales bacterium]
MCKTLLLTTIFGISVGLSCNQKETSAVSGSDEESLDWWHEARFGMFIYYWEYMPRMQGFTMDMNHCRVSVCEYREN